MMRRAAWDEFLSTSARGGGVSPDAGRKGKYVVVVMVVVGNRYS